ncbi:MAG: hypothetical protein WAV00_08255 [Nocardioides sp.]
MSATTPPARPRARRRAGLLTAAVAAFVGALLTTACLPAQASNVRVTGSIFGMHDGSGGVTSYGAFHEGAVRLWDAGVQWRDIETSRNHYHWARLDQLVSAARAHGARVTMVVAGTPRFYSRTPWNVPTGRVDEYKRFVRHLMTRYRGRIDSYQVWNESNITTFWTGTQRRMAQLTKGMHDVRNAVAPHAEVVAPPMVARLPYELAGIKTYETQRVGGKPVWRYYDVVALSLYPMPRYGRRTGVPEDAITLLNAAKRELRRAGVPASKPIWDTEINYGLQSGSRGGTAAAPISRAKQTANVARTYLLQAANGVKRVFWYRYDWGRIPGGGTIGNTLLTDPDNTARMTAAGHAYVRVQTWMHGTLQGKPGHRPCAKDSHGTYRCLVTDSSGTRRIYWNPFHRATVKLAAGARHKQYLTGAPTGVRGGATLRVDFRPVVVYH